jgi:hypothetical protein
VWSANAKLEIAIVASIRMKKQPIFGIVLWPVQKLFMTLSLLFINASLRWTEKMDGALLGLINELEAAQFQELPETDDVVAQIAEALRQQAVLNFSDTVIATVQDKLSEDGFRALFAHYRDRLTFVKANMELVKTDLETLWHSTRLSDDCEENSTDLRLNFTRTVLAVQELVAEWGYTAALSSVIWNLHNNQRPMVTIPEYADVTDLATAEVIA